MAEPSETDPAPDTVVLVRGELIDVTADEAPSLQRDQAGAEPVELPEHTRG